MPASQGEKWFESGKKNIDARLLKLRGGCSTPGVPAPTTRTPMRVLRTWCPLGTLCARSNCSTDAVARLLEVPLPAPKQWLQGNVQREGDVDQAENNDNGNTHLN